METNQPTIGLPVATKTVQAPRGANARDLLRSIVNPPEGWHSYPFRVFVTSADSAPFGRHHVAVYHTATRTLQVGAFSVGGPIPLCVVDTEAPDAALMAAEAWLRYAPMRGAGVAPSGSILWCWRELHPGKTTLMPNGAALLPYVYFECLAGLRYTVHRSGHPAPAGEGRVVDMCKASQQGWGHSHRTHGWRFHGEHETAERCGWMKKMFRSRPFVQAVKALKVDGDHEPLMEYLNDRITFGGELMQRRQMPTSVLVRLVRRVSEGALTVTDCRHVVLDGDEVTTTSGSYTYCPRCADRHFITTAEGDIEHSDDVYYWDRDGCYHTYEEPEEVCDDDDDDDEDSPLLSSWGASTAYLGHDKSFVPSPHGDFTMGIELEVETVGSRAGDLSRCDDHFSAALKGTRRYAMFKRDGSLDEYKGFEIVTAARRLSDHMQAFGTWSPPRDLRAWDADSSCGMHVHVDSRAFTALSLGRFVQLYNDPDNAVFIKAIAGRHPSYDKAAENYAAAVSVDNDGHSGVNPASATKKAGETRYEMVNLTNLTEGEADRLKLRASRDCKGDYSTVEVRVFKATTKRARLLAQIEFVHATVIYCRTAGNHELNGRAFLKWLATTAGQYKHLARWFDVFVPKATKQRPTVARNQPVNFAETI